MGQGCAEPTGSSRLGLDPAAGCCEHGNEPLGSIKDREFLY